MDRLCEKCSTPLGADGACVTCAADAEGLKLVTQSGFASVREMMSLLEEQGLSPEMEKIPPARPEEVHHPRWNLYVPAEEVERAVEFLRKDWADLLGDPEAAAAAERGRKGVDLDAGGELECPACGHRFVPAAREVECPECGLALGERADAAPDEAKGG